MKEFLTDDDLFDVLAELNKIENEEDDVIIEMDEEMEASAKRYEEIIRKYES